MNVNVINYHDPNHLERKCNSLDQNESFSFPAELVFQIFADTTLSTLGAISCVNKTWQQLISSPLLWNRVLYQEKAFTTRKWVNLFKDEIIEEEEDDFSSLPLNPHSATLQEIEYIF